MTEAEKIIKQVFRNPQVQMPPISYKITDVGINKNKDYTSEYIDVGDFKSFLDRLEKQLIYRFRDKKYAKK